MQHFTPLAAIVGGGLIGLSAAILWVGNGRIAGISGIVGRLAGGIPADAGWQDWAWPAAFLAGLIVAPWLYAEATGHLPRIAVPFYPPLLVLAGLLVGFGTRLGGGCTSGHGVCGLARVSRRSITATALFMASAVLTVFLVRHGFGV